MKKKAAQRVMQSGQKSVPQFETAISAMTNAERVLIAFPLAYTPDSLAAAVVLGQLLRAHGTQVVLASPGGGYGHDWLLGEESVLKSLANTGEFVIRVNTLGRIVDRVQYTPDDHVIDLILTPKVGRLTPADVSFPGGASNFDLIVTLGATSRADLGPLWEDYPGVWAESPIIALSAGLQSANFATTSVSVPRAGSMAEVIWEMLQHTSTWKSELTPQLATVLLAGVIGATGSFLEGHTTPGSLRTAGQLLTMGADHTHVIDQLFKSKPMRVVKLWGAVLRSLQLDRMHQVTWARLSASDYAEAGAHVLDTRGISDQLLRHVNGSQISALLSEDGADVRIEVRSSGQAHLFENLVFGEGYSVTHVPHGVDLRVPNQSLAQVEMEFLRDLMSFQKERLGLPSNLPITKVNALKEALEAPAPVAQHHGKAPKNWADADVPFIAPEV